MKVTLGVLLLSLLTVLTCFAGEVVSADGTRHVGDITARDGQLVIRPADGQEQTLAWSQIRKLTQNPPANSPQHGLLGEYFADQEMKQICRVRVDPVIDWFWPGKPDPVVPHDFCTRWTDTIRPQFTETYTFECEKDDDVNLWIDGKQVVKGWLIGDRVLGGKIDLQAGKDVPIRLEFRDRMGDAVIRLFWSSPSLPREIVPGNRLFPAPIPEKPLPETPQQKTLPKGVRAEFATDFEWTSPKPIVRKYPCIDFDWGFGRPDLVGTDNFASRFTFRIRPQYSGLYTFDLGHEADASLDIEGKRVFGAPQAVGTIKLEAGKLYEATLMYRKRGGEPGRLHLYWAGMFQDRQIVPEDCLYAPAVDPLASIPGDGALRTEYFADLECKQLAMIRYEPNIALQCNGPSPDPRVPEAYSVRWTGRLKVDNTDTYAIHARHDDGIFIWIDGRKVLEHNEFGEDEFKIPLDAGRLHDIRVEMNNRGGGPTMALLSWSCSKFARQVIPPSAYARGDDQDALCPLAIIQPAAGAVLDAAKPIVLQAQTNDQANASEVEFLAEGKVIGTATARPFEYSWPKAQSGVVHLSARVKNAKGQCIGMATPIAVIVADSTGLGSPWLALCTDHQQSSASVKDRTCDLAARGGELLDRQDACSLLLRKTQGDFAFSGNLAELSGSDGISFSAAGLTIREGLEPYARHLSILRNDAGRPQILLRTAREAQADSVGSEEQTISWMRVTRVGSKLGLWGSRDGKSWRLLRSEKMDLPQELYVGMMAATQSTGAVVARFTSITTEPAVPPQGVFPQGVILKDGSLIAGEIASIKADLLRVHCLGARDLAIPTRYIARLLLHSSPATMPADAQGKTGVILLNGDFADGAIRRLSGSDVTIESLAMGLMSLSRNQVEQVLLVPPADPPAAIVQIRTCNGSSLLGKSVRISHDVLEIVTPCGFTVAQPFSEIVEIDRPTTDP